MQIAQLGSWELYADGKFIVSTELRQLYHFPLEGDILIDEFFNNIHTDDVAIVKEKIALSQHRLQLEEVDFNYYPGSIEYSESKEKMISNYKELHNWYITRK